jgi:hypothetical protein
MSVINQSPKGLVWPMGKNRRAADDVKLALVVTFSAWPLDANVPLQVSVTELSERERFERW